MADDAWTFDSASGNDTLGSTACSPGSSGGFAMAFLLVGFVMLFAPVNILARYVPILGSVALVATLAGRRR